MNSRSKQWLYNLTVGWIISFFKEVITVSKAIGWLPTSIVVTGVVAVFYSPAIYGVIVGNYALTTAYIAFWALPFTPAMGIMFGVIWGVLKLIDRRTHK